MLLTDEQCDEFRRLPMGFNGMVRAIYKAGMERAAEIADRHNLVCDGGDDDGTILAFGASIGDAIREALEEK